jgi:hypothetical protein
MEQVNTIGAITAIWIYIFSILVFLARLVYKPKLEKLVGILLFISAIPLVYLLATASTYQRPVLYYIQVSLMLLWIAVAIMVDYVLKVDFRQNLRWVILYVTLFFAGTGGMLGVASLAGSAWMYAAIALFLVMAVLTFYQRAKTGK